MSDKSPPFIQTLTPERWLGWSMDFIGAGYIGLLVKNGRCVRIWYPGRHLSFALPWLEKCELILVDGKLRNLQIISQGDFLSRDQYLVNVSLNVMYQVVDPARVVLEISDPITALTSEIKDNLGVAISQLSVEQLLNQGRVQIRNYLLENTDAYYALGFNIDVRVSDISFPQTRGVIRQVEGMSARQEAEHEAGLQMQIAEAGRPELQPPPVQQVNIVSGSDSNLDDTLQDSSFALKEELTSSKALPTKSPMGLAPTVLLPNPEGVIARLVNCLSGARIVISITPFTIGREASNNLVLEDPLCSRNHAQIIQDTDAEGNLRYQLIDMGSSNGTFVEEQRLAANQPFQLSSEDVIRIGTQEWTFQLSQT
ncbi:MAG: FHA domain-containing protein [Symploca sp. SIO2E9]|nr:FHA domain-containing protein [Symploca sp. SIO2E9]